MNKDQYTRLQKYEEQLRTATIGNYVRKMYTDTINELDAIYFELFKTPSKLKTGCGKCILAGTKRIAQEYFKYKEKLENKDNKKDTKDGK